MNADKVKFTASRKIRALIPSRLIPKLAKERDVKEKRRIS